MSKKLFISLVPLLATAAFAVMPVAAPAAEPHWYLDTPGGMASGAGPPIPTGDPVPTVSWGVLELRSMTPSPIKCQIVALGNVENPTTLVGAGPETVNGVGKLFNLAAYNCENDECLGPGTGAEIAITPEMHNPWQEFLVKLGAAISIETTGVELNIACVAIAATTPYRHNKEPIQSFPSKATPEQIHWPVPAIVAGPFECSGNLRSGFKNGTGTYSEIPFKFLYATPEPSLTCPLLGTVTPVGKIKSMDFETSETLEIYAP